MGDRLRNRCSKANVTRSPVKAELLEPMLLYLTLTISVPSLNGIAPKNPEVLVEHLRYVSGCPLSLAVC